MAHKHQRRAERLAHFDAAKGVRNEQLQQLGSPPLLEQEFVGARLYTGPMYVRCRRIERGTLTSQPHEPQPAPCRLPKLSRSTCCPGQVQRGAAARGRVGRAQLDGG